ncbi:hypothetical protein [Pararhodospirillum photometricum]|uniref:Uncharacterized protein n=1 Tax=Pararhodospirillum photometricum DSM 122 TaxID=1150469 RepID=H6SJ34_PARPM|nr:hypothetical protein [Pararhodospirillum photometricum]CCG07999.1 Putative uncharacterized protein [Pararhodospirillum photometricum DSM 122]
MLPLRVDLLFRLGLHGDVIALLAQAPLGSLPPALERGRRDALMLQDQLDAVCAAPPEDDRDPASARHGLRVRVVCEARSGQGEAAALGMGLLRETREADETFLILAERLAGLSQARLRKPTLSDAVDVVLYREAQEPVPAALLKDAAPWLLRAVALSGPSAPAVRLEAAERAEARGALPTEALVFLYGDTPQAEAGASPSGQTPLARAALVQSLRNAVGEGAVLVDPAVLGGGDLSQALPAALQVLAATRLRDAALYQTVARVLAPALARVPVQRSLAEAAPEMARALYLAGDVAHGAGWLWLLQDEARVRPELAPLAQALASLDRVAGGHGLASEALSRPEAPVALGRPAASGSLSRLEQEAALGRRGRVALLALAVLGEAGGPVQASAEVLARVCAALEQVGLVEEARALAVEALGSRA